MTKSKPKGPLHVFEGLPLPVSVMTEVSAFIGRRGQGKSFASRKFTEQLLKIGAQVIYLDPPGNAHGLRLAADGKSPGFNIPVFGGLHGDIPLEAGSGVAVADLIVDLGISAVLDLSELDEPGQVKFAGDFARQFYQRKKAKRSACTIILEEAQEFVPQNPQPNQTTMLHHFTRLAKIGRNFGIGLCLVTLRPQDVNKKVLDLTEMMVAFQMNAPRERAAMKDWMGAKGLDENLLDVLPTLKQGRPYVYSPQLLNFIGEVQVLHTETYDTSATPEFGAESARPVELTPIDLEGIRGTLAATIERLKAEDPKALKAEIAALRKQLQQAQTAKPAAAPASRPAEVKVVEVPALKADDLKRLNSAVTNLYATADKLSEMVGQARDVGKTITDQLQALRAAPPRPPAARPQLPTRPAPIPSAPRVAAGDDGDLPKGERAVLEALIQYPEGLRRDQITVITGYKKSTRNTYIERLRQRNFAAVNGETVTATDAGRQALPDAQPLPTGAALRELVLQRLPQGERAILQVLLDAHPDAVDRNTLTDLTGYKKSTRNAYITRLAGKKLAEDVGPGQVQASDRLFGEG